MMNGQTIFSILLCVALLVSGVSAAEPVRPREVRIRDLITVEGVRDNALIGYGMVVGLNGTGDRSQTMFTTQTLANVLQRMGVQVSPTAIKVNNVAAVFVTSSLPPFAHPGTRVDVTVSSMGDAKSLEGGLLLLTSLRAADGQVYASTQGPLTFGGYSAGPQGNSKQVNHPTVARIPEGGIVEREAAVDLRHMAQVSLLLRESSFSSARDVAAAINREFGKDIAVAADGRRIDLNTSQLGSPLTTAMARIEGLSVAVDRRARVVVNERSGTVVMGKDVRLRAVSILHGNLSIEISTDLQVSQPQPFGTGETVTVPQTSVRAQDAPARKVELSEGASVEQLVNGLQAIGATARDVIAILQAIKAAGALDADLEAI
jgi:flagellar P-ring protein FlgI